MLLSPRTRPLVSADHSGVFHKVGYLRTGALAASLASPSSVWVSVLSVKKKVGWAGAPRSSHSLTRLPITSTLVNWLKYRAQAPASSPPWSTPTPPFPSRNHSQGPSSTNRIRFRDSPALGRGHSPSVPVGWS